MQEVKKMIREVPNFPKEGINFIDITTAIKDAPTMKKIIDFFVEKFKDKNIDYVAGIESRGFIFGMPVAYELNCGFIPIRKPKKLPAQTIGVDYSLEYGMDRIEMHKDAVEEGKNVLIIDDLLATGGTACAACKLVELAGAKLAGVGFVVELTELEGIKKLPEGAEIITILKY
jgi:adenine phosphoribosyltransferase